MRVEPQDERQASERAWGRASEWVWERNEQPEVATGADLSSVTNVMWRAEGV